MHSFKPNGKIMFSVGSAVGIFLALLHSLFFTLELPGLGLLVALTLPALFLGYLTGIFVFLAEGICGKKPYGAGDAIDLPPCHANVEFVLLVLANALFYGFVFWAVWRLVPLIKTSRKRNPDLYLGAGIGFLAGLAFDLIFLTGLVRIPETIAILPALPLLSPWLNRLILGQSTTDSQSIYRLIVYLYISWPIFGALLGTAIAYARDAMKRRTKPHA